jgi:uncharacterized protein
MRLSLTRALVAAVAATPPVRGRPELNAASAEGWAVLCDLDATHPGAVAEVFAYPYTQAWAIRCLRPPRGADPELDRAHLAGLAASAALRAGVTAELPVPVRDGMLHLPLLGALDARPGAGATVRVAVSQGRLVAGNGPAWHAVRRVTGSGFQVAVEDLDPFRDCQQWATTARLSELEWLGWRRGLAAAGRGLTHGLPAYARVLKAGLRTVVPLLPAPVGMRSATTRYAFGAVGLALPDDADAIAELLVHEFQHTKLFALSDFHELLDRASTQRLRVPWRDDPRPVEGVLHGIYAHLALAQLSRSRGAQERDVWLRYRAWVCDACEALQKTKALTADGERFVAGMLLAVQDDLVEERNV